MPLVKPVKSLSRTLQTTLTWPRCTPVQSNGGNPQHNHTTCSRNHRLTQNSVEGGHTRTTCRSKLCNATVCSTLASLEAPSIRDRDSTSAAAKSPSTADDAELMGPTVCASVAPREREALGAAAGGGGATSGRDRKDGPEARRGSRPMSVAATSHYEAPISTITGATGIIGRCEADFGTSAVGPAAPIDTCDGDFLAKCGRTQMGVLRRTGPFFLDRC